MRLLNYGQNLYEKKTFELIETMFSFKNRVECLFEANEESNCHDYEFFSFKKYINKNLDKILVSLGYGIWKDRKTKISKFLMKILSEKNLLEYRSKENFAIIDILVRFGDSDDAFLATERMFPITETLEVLSKRLSTYVLKKDKEGVNLIDYCFLNRKNAVADYFKSLISVTKNENGEEIDYKFPKLLKMLNL